ncbi:hypothetical protein ACFOD9_06410 [Novosphingobium bradum]|uniref:Uncharacterized protein n=1 Tax=Novosphingobium bradum TaxID=1737444 RepID=A0ABV7IQI4_9SPHN
MCEDRAQGDTAWACIITTMIPGMGMGMAMPWATGTIMPRPAMAAPSPSGWR